jgi:hypothetical protein
MAASHPEMFRHSTVDERELIKLVDAHLLPSRVVLQWQPAKDEDIPTPNTNEIIASMTFLHRGFGLPALDFLHSWPPQPLQNRANPF